MRIVYVRLVGEHIFDRGGRKGITFIFDFRTFNKSFFDINGGDYVY